MPGPTHTLACSLLTVGKHGAIGVGIRCRGHQDNVEDGCGQDGETAQRHQQLQVDASGSCRHRQTQSALAAAGRHNQPHWAYDVNKFSLAKMIHKHY